VFSKKEVNLPRSAELNSITRDQLTNGSTVMNTNEVSLSMGTPNRDYMVCLYCFDHL
jgi:hypothetical protein